MLRWLRETMGGSAAGVNAMFGALEEIFNPPAAQARKEQHERVIPIPSPGDKLLAEGRVVIPGTPKAQPATRAVPAAQSREAQPSKGAVAEDPPQDLSRHTVAPQATRYDSTSAI